MSTQSLNDVDFDVTLRGYPTNDFLTREEEQRIASLPKDHPDRWKLVEHNMQWLCSFAAKFAKSNKAIHDGNALISSLQDAMIESSRGFKPLGYRFITYAMSRLRWAALEQAQQQSAPVKLPRWSERNRKYLRAEGRYYVFFPEEEREHFFDMAMRESGYVSQTPDDLMILKYLKRDVHELVRQVKMHDHKTGRWKRDTRSAKILSLYFAQDMTLNEVGETLNISKERVRQLKDRALAWMRKKRHLKEYLDA